MNTCTVTRIYFNYYKTGREEGPECGTNVMPEDLSRFPTLPYNAVAFSMSGTKGKRLKFHAEFSGPSDGSASIRAVDPFGPLGKQVGRLKQFMREAGINLDEKGKPVAPERLLGDVDPKSVTFDKDGNSFVFVKGTPVNPVDRDEGVVEFEVDHVDFDERGICASWQFWQWQYSLNGGKSWHVAEGLPYSGISVHRVFVTLDSPGWPWTQFNEDVKVVQENFYISRPPYVGALEWASKWAEGMKTEHDIARSITSELYHSGRFKYALSTIQNYTSPFQNYFDCGRFIDRLNGKFGRGPKVNCVDCAHMVVSLANALGCQLQAGRIKNPEGSQFKLNTLTLIGHHKTCEITAFAYHQVAFYLRPDDDGKRRVYDACITCSRVVFDEARNEAPRDDPSSKAGQDIHPTGIPLGKSVFSPGYLALLAKREREKSQEDLGLHAGDDQIFSVGSVKFF